MIGRPFHGAQGKRFDRAQGKRLALAFAILAIASRAVAQTPAAASRPWEITDNSFLVEEAFNQEPGVVQNILTWTRSRDGGWAGNFTQEWPAPGMTHQLSYSIVFANSGSGAGLGDALLNYRYQLRKETAGGPAIAPRISVVLPTGREDKGLGGGTAGLDLNVPASKQFGNFYLHGNIGYTWLPDVQRTTHVAGSGIWRVAPMFNVMLETVVNVAESVTVSPGFRRGWNFGEKQLVIGLAVPITWTDQGSSPALLTYFSYELPFQKR